ncbi:unnamed protein product [Thelazia callipaeda]|uniref:Threonylcarbamoyl-AMP synthase n=1 Tax=Thelazia callipaeda TaxID=103827 RepID=A0A0N5CWE9_THECL|nr:unnamed protein product [Thelazia callipaeda]
MSRTIYLAFDSAIQRCLRVFESGGVVALPTDTLYGVVTTIPNSDKLYRLKRRSYFKPLGLFIANTFEVQSNQLQKLLPGPVTLIFERSAVLPRDFNPNHSTVGIRIPDHDFIRSLALHLNDIPLAQTSANISNAQNNPLCIDDFTDLWPQLDLIRPDGTLNYEGSTVVNLSIPGTFSIVRDGWYVYLI